VNFAEVRAYSALTRAVLEEAQLEASWRNHHEDTVDGRNPINHQFGMVKPISMGFINNLNPVDGRKTYK